MIPELNFAESKNHSIFFNPILPEIVLDCQRNKANDNYKENIYSEDLLDDNCNQVNHIHLLNDIPT